MLLGMAVIWAVNYSVVKHAVRVLPPLAFNAVRMTLATAVLAVLALVLRERRPTRRDAAALLLLGVLGNGVYQLLFIEGIARTRAGNVAIVFAATPAFVALIGWLRGVERTGARGGLGIAASIAGIALLVIGGGGAAGEATLRGDLLVLAGALCWSTFSVLVKPYSDRVSVTHVAALTLASGTLVNVAPAATQVAAVRWAELSAAAWGAIVYGGVVALVIAYYFWNHGVRALGPTRTAVYGNLQPAIALAVAWMTLGEVPTAWQLGGAGAIVAGVLLTRA
jgi:drug/metabolite transporter (DMT)-like permease